MTNARSILKRYCLLSLASVSVLEFFLVPLEFARFSMTLQDHGILGLLGLHSLLTIQIWVLLSVIVFAGFAFFDSFGPAFRVCTATLVVAVVVYSLSLYLIYAARTYGMFAFGFLGLVGLFGFLPSVLILIIGLPITFTYAICNSEP